MTQSSQPTPEVPTSENSAPEKSASGSGPSEVQALAVLVATAGATALWSGHLWSQLLQSRGGADVVCVFGGSDCAQLWDSRFATAVHQATGVPVAGWGLAWGLTALLLALVALISSVRRKPAPGVRAALPWAAAGGVLAVGALVVVSGAQGQWCSSCSVVYFLTAVFAVTVFAFLGERGQQGSKLQGLLVVLAVFAGSYALMLYPGLRTPAAGAAQEALQSAPRSGGLEGFLTGLTPDLQQAVSQALGRHRAATTLPQPEMRAPLGDPAAPVRLTEFTDIRCSHCATLHQTLDALWNSAPKGSFVIDSRHFPLDGRCNPRLPPRDGEPVSCTAALARICFESQSKEQREAYATRLFDAQRELTLEQVFSFAEPVMDAAALRQCVQQPEVQQSLEDDLAFAWQHTPRGTPLVLINGREAVAFGPFLYAMILAGGDLYHPAFEQLPPPSLTPPGS
ncbi:MAG: thioredoxin domain-containing protein [Acidobacteriota bacterium]|nr:thioredoxin domain-containing protein [Acidobacteriota bacterium]